MNLARVFTGYDWDYRSNGGTSTPVAWERQPDTEHALRHQPHALQPRQAFQHGGEFSRPEDHRHDTPGRDALHIALDRLFYHDNTGPFFARQMIQRLVTSNPSPAYVERVATVFGNNGSGVRGDLKAVWTAILTDEEARAMPTAADTLFGKLREPIVRFVQWARTAEVTSDNDEYQIDDLSDTDTMLGQSPLRSPSVFNFFRPGYVPPNTEIATAGKQAPEFQLHNESSTAGYINFMQRVTRKGIRGRQADLHHAAARRARCAGGGRLAQPAAHRQPVVRRNAGGCHERAQGYNITESTVTAPSSTCWPRPVSSS